MRRRVAPFSVFYLALAIYFKRIGGVDRFTIGVPIFNRRNFTEKQTSGMFVSTLPFSSEISGEWSLYEFGDKLNETWLDMLRYSISHSGEWWLCAFSDRPVGIDLQRCVSFVSPKTLSRRFFHPQEDSFLLQDSYEYFYDLWTAKESWVKFTGRGFYDEPESFSVVSEDGSFPSAEGAQLRHIPFRDGYSLCVCAEVIGTIIFRELN